MSTTQAALVAFFLCFLLPARSAPSPDFCPPMPAQQGVITHDVKGKIDASAGALWKLGAVQLGIGAEEKASMLLGTFPQVGQVIMLQTLSSTYCNFLVHSGLSNAEIINRWEVFQERMIKLEFQSQDAPPIRSVNAAVTTTVDASQKTTTGQMSKDSDDTPIVLSISKPRKPPSANSASPVKDDEHGLRFAKTGCGSIKDRATGYEWMIGSDQNTSWEVANSWISHLSACGGNWQMPVAAQLRALFIADSVAGEGFQSGNKRWPAHLDPIFSAIGEGSWVWAKTSLNSNTPIFYNYNQGVAVELEKYQPQYTTRAFAVR